jgi:pimeloyl-ACP methyl ester carboxylesterase
MIDYRTPSARQAQRETPPRAEAAHVERTFTLPYGSTGGTLLLRNLFDNGSAPSPGASVLYVHGATFPSALSLFWRFDGVSWADRLVDAGFDAWGLDFIGFGGSSRPIEMTRSPIGEPPIGRADDAAQQIKAAADFIRRDRNLSKVSIIAHSWGTIATGRYAGQHPDAIDRLVFFGPITQRAMQQLPDPETLGGWRYITAAEQWKRFTEDVPQGHPPVLLDRHFRPWAASYIATDPSSQTRDPPSVATPNGPAADITAAWRGKLAYDPGAIRAPTLIVRGEWDNLVQDTDAAWLRTQMPNAQVVRDIKIKQGSHLMHLEESRHALHQASIDFLTGG